MSLAALLSNDFDAAVRNRGKVYYWQQRVRIRMGSGRSVQALVRGSRTYEVILEWQSGAVTLDCDCEYFDSSGPCKHLWATILAADAKGYMSEAKAAPGPQSGDGFSNPERDLRENLQRLTFGQRPPDDATTRRTSPS